MAALAVAIAAPVTAQGLGTDPITLAGGRVALGGDFSVVASCAHLPDGAGCGEDQGFFNYSDYNHSTVRIARLAFSAAVRANRQFSFLTEVRSENGERPEPYALYARIRPWPTHAFDLQVGRIPPTFGTFGRRTYASDNLLIGYPLAYQYLTSLRPDAVPADADALLRMRGRGWLSSFTLGNTAPAHGLPLVSASRWDTGIQAHAAASWADASLAVTNGSLGNPRVRDDNAGKQIAGRVSLRPTPGLAIGISGARAPYLTRDLVRAVVREPNSNAFNQTALGIDLEYSRDYYLLRAETIVSHWQLPTLAPALSATGLMVEGRYKLRPGRYVAARVDHLGFSEIVGTTRTAGWDAPLTRIEVGGGYRLQRNLELKMSVQRNVRDDGRVPRLTIASAQIGFWF